MFNIQGSELIFLLLVALVILGPEKLPDAVRKAAKAYGEFKKMANGFQGEMRQVLDEPMRELRGTADMVRDAAKFDIDLDPSKPRQSPAVSEIAPKPAPIKREAGLNFGSANPRRQERVARTDEPDTPFADTTAGTTADTPEPGSAASPEPSAAAAQDTDE